MKTILIPMESHDVPSTLETALLLAPRYDSYMEGFALRWQISEISWIDLLGDLPLEYYDRAIEERRQLEFYRNSQFEPAIMRAGAKVGRILHPVGSWPYLNAAAILL